MEKKENNYIGKKIITIPNQDYLGEIIKNKGIFYKTDKGHFIKKTAEGKNWEKKTDNYIGKNIMGIENKDYWGKIIKNEGTAFRLNKGRIAKKITEGNKWEIIQDNYNGTIERNNGNYYILNSGIKVKKYNENERWTIKNNENEEKKNGNEIQYIGKKIKELVNINLSFEHKYEDVNNGSYRSIIVEIEGNSLENINIKLIERHYTYYSNIDYDYDNENNSNRNQSNNNENNKNQRKKNRRNQRKKIIQNARTINDTEEYNIVTIKKFFDDYYTLLYNKYIHYDNPPKIKLFMESLIKAYNDCIWNDNSWNDEMKRYRRVKSL
jgi:hypothetical protein